MDKKIRFIHSDGKEYCFETRANPLNGCQMYTFDEWYNCYTSDKRSINSIIEKITQKAQVISVEDLS